MRKLFATLCVLGGIALASAAPVSANPASGLIAAKPAVTTSVAAEPASYRRRHHRRFGHYGHRRHYGYYGRPRYYGYPRHYRNYGYNNYGYGYYGRRHRGISLYF